MIVPLPRVARNGDDGSDVHGHKRAVTFYLKDMTLRELEGKPKAVREHFGEALQTRVNRVRADLGYGQSGIIDSPLYQVLRERGYYDLYALDLIHRWAVNHSLSLCYPFPSNVVGPVCQGLHQTAGLLGNWAIDFCAPPLSPIVAVEAGVIDRLSGHDPNDDTWDSQGVYGWSTYILTRHGYRYFLTHQGRRESGIRVGVQVNVGDPVGYVGDQAFRPDHVHYGVSSPLGTADAKRRITMVSKAKKVTL
jgi:murein DD-endopeptidase MepM/ murein hydrolase activator NlpD